MRIKVIKQNKTWEEAFDYCEDHHTRLLEIHNRQDQDAVVEWLKHTDVEGPFWIALRQSRLFGFWIWSDRPVTYHNWTVGRPPELPLFFEHCGVINKTDDYKWHGENCLTPQQFLCEEDIIYM